MNKEEAIEVYKELTNEKIKEAFEFFAPELRESEDERIRKELIQFLQLPHPQFVGKRNHEEWISWLEKQKPTWSEGVKRMFIKALERVEEQNNKGYKLTDCDKNSWWEDFKTYCGYAETQKPNFCHHEVDLSNCSEEYRKAYYDGWNNCNQQHAQLEAEQKPAWSRENSCYYDDICEILINLINSPTSNVNKDAVQKDLDWLMSIKESQLKLSWSEEDEKTIKNLSDIIVANSKNNYLGNYYTPDLIRKLQSLCPARKSLNQEWSEDDEQMLQKALSTIRYALSIPIDKEDDPCFTGSSTIAWLKSLKERYSWKPSDEQTEALNDAISSRDIKYDILSELWKDLKKLRKE